VSWLHIINILFHCELIPQSTGIKISLAVEESHAMPLDDPNTHKPFGVGYTTTQTFPEAEGPLDLDISKNRVFKILNESVLNPFNGLPVGFQLVPHPSQMLLAHPTSLHTKRSEFGAHALWVTKHNDGEVRIFQFLPIAYLFQGKRIGSLNHSYYFSG
jgi:primary-amine oxidase